MSLKKIDKCTKNLVKSQDYFHYYRISNNSFRKNCIFMHLVTDMQVKRVSLCHEQLNASLDSLITTDRLEERRIRDEEEASRERP